MVTAQRDLHNLFRLPALFCVGRGHDGRDGGTDSKDARLWRVDDCCEVCNIVHAQVRYGKRAAL